MQRIFQYTADQVPLIAKNVGGIQKPEIRVPRGGESFPIDLLTKEDRERIRLNAIKPLVIQPRLLNRNSGFDNLQLEAAVEEALRDRSYGDGRTNDVAPFVYEAVPQQGAARLVGTYTLSGDAVKVKLFIRRDDQTVRLLPEVTGNRRDVTAIADPIVKTFVTELASLNKP